MTHVASVIAQLASQITPKKRGARPFGRAITTLRFHPPCLGD